MSVVDGSLMAIIFLAPYLLGGRHDVGRLAYVALIASASTAWFARQHLRRASSSAQSAACWLFGGGIALLMFQVAPLPASWLATLSPRTAELLPVWTQPGEPGYLGPWTTLSLTPDETRLSLMMLLSYGLLFTVVAQRVQNDQDIQRLVRWIGISAGCMALLGLVQWTASNGRFLWIYEHPSRSTDMRLSGAFTNRNHFAHFLVLGAPALVACLFASQRPGLIAAARTNGDWRTRLARLVRAPDAHVAALAIAVVVTILLSCSRGGAIALGVAAGVAILIPWRAGALQTRQLVALSIVAAGVLSCVSIVGYDRLTQRLATLAAGSIEALDEQEGRRKIWAANVEAIKSGGWLGSGAGSHREIYPTYMADPPPKQFTHAESGYLQVVTENGVVGGALLLLAIIACVGWSQAALRGSLASSQLAFRAACLAGLAASAVHSVFDFVWYLPACLCPTLVLAACLMRSSQFDAPARRRFASTWKLFDAVPSAAIPVAVALVASLPVIQFIGPARSSLHWDAYQRVARADRALNVRLLSKSPGATDELIDDPWSAREAMLDSMVRQLEQAVRLRPTFADAHRHLAARLSQWFELRQSQSTNPMPVAQIRDAALASDFTSGEQLQEWLGRAFPENGRLLYRASRHARLAVRLSPLQGDAYVRLADLCFLKGRQVDAVDAYLKQALRVRPHDADMLVDVGKQYIGRGMPAAAIDAWSHAFQLTGPHRTTIARHMAGNWPMPNFLMVFRPQWDTIPEVWRSAQAAAAPQDADVLLKYAIDQAVREDSRLSGEDAANHWRALASMQQEVGQPAPALDSLRRAVALDQANYAGRRALGEALSAEGRHDEARKHLDWCLARRPGDSMVNAALKRPVQQRIASLARIRQSPGAPSTPESSRPWPLATDSAQPSNLPSVVQDE